MDAKEFKERFGRNPKQDDLHRVNCEHVGQIGHFQCGLCPEHNTARFSCGCLATTPRPAAK